MDKVIVGWKVSVHQILNKTPVYLGPVFPDHIVKSAFYFKKNRCLIIIIIPDSQLKAVSVPVYGILIGFQKHGIQVQAVNGI